MATRTKTGHWTGDAGDVYIPVGFVPDFLLVVNMSATNPIVYAWWEAQQDDEASGYQEGFTIPGTGGTLDQLADAAGITAYNGSGRRPDIGTWEASSGTLTSIAGNTLTLTARTSTAAGTLCRGTLTGTDLLGASVDREAIFECVATSGNTGSTEPSWPVEVGGQVVDGSNTWELVTDSVINHGRYGYQGFLFADNINANSNEFYYLAIQSDDQEDHGDCDGWPSGIKGS